MTRLPGPARRLVRRWVANAGYELVPRARLGLDPWADVARLIAPAVVRTVFDVGAHEGETYLELRRRFPAARIYCVEPYSAAFEALARRLAGDARAQAIRAALGDTDGEATLHCHRRSHWNSLLPDSATIGRLVPAPLISPAGSEPCEVRRLDTLCRDLRVDHIDLLKLDAQGFELHILRGAGDLLTTRRIRLIHTEVSLAHYYDGQCSFEALVAYLRSNGYGLVDLYVLDHARAEDGSLLWCDLLFLAPA
jgi:FkbM family methyltransferase